MTQPEIIPREVLFGNPTRTAPELSADGSKLAYIAPVDGVLNVWVGDASGDDFKPLTRDTDRGVRFYFWRLDGSSIIYIQDKGGDENWLIYETVLETGETRCLTPFENVQAQIGAYNKRHPDQMIVELNVDNEQLHDPYLLDLPTGQLRKLEENPGNVLAWVSDMDLRVRGRLAAQDHGGFDFEVRDEPGGEWSTLMSWTHEENLNSGPVGFTADGESVYVRDSRNSNASRLLRVNLATRNEEVLAEDETYDVSSLMIHPDDRRLQMVGFQKDRLEWKIVDESIRADMDVIRKLSRGEYSVFDRTADDDRWLVAFDRDDGPVEFWHYDRGSKKAELLFVNRPDLTNYELAPMKPVSFESRDGLTIHGYLTLPVGLEPEQLPMVLNVHGGPWHRDTWGYDPEVQWLANRGYAVLQVNFRGSTGYGKDFVNAGDRQWGGKMHDDLLDAVAWAVSQGFADRDRVCIYGGSYGGYAALVGATMTPEAFKCAVDIVGPSNLITFLNSVPPYWETYREVLNRRVGHVERDEQFLVERSPLTHVDDIRIPMLIAQGANDPRVKQAESEQIVAAMKEKGIPHEYLLFEDEGHGFAKPDNRLKFYEATEKFLAEHLGGRSE